MKNAQKQGVAVDYVSPKGGFVPLDPRSMRYTDESIMKIYESRDFIERGLRNSLAPKDVNSDDYSAIYYTGGHGVMWDFPNNPELQKIALIIYNHGGYITSVCHGIAGKKVTGFTTAEEIIAGKKSVVPFLNQREAKKRGTHFVKKRFYKNSLCKMGI